MRTTPKRKQRLLSYSTNIFSGRHKIQRGTLFERKHQGSLLNVPTLLPFTEQYTRRIHVDVRNVCDSQKPPYRICENHCGNTVCPNVSGKAVAAVTAVTISEFVFRHKAPTKI
jgi:hypothetical protein